MDKSVIGGYKIEDKLGEGGMGTVYRASDPTLERPVAVKVIRKDGLSHEAKARFLREARACSRLSHPNIITVYSAGEEDGHPYMAMELLDGQTMLETIEAGAIPWQRAAAWAVGLLDALGRLHEEGIVHRDLKPENIFVTADGVPKLMDFGIAHMDTATSLTADGTTMGTAHYMSPEQASGKKSDPRSDVFSMGCVLYQMVTGQLPFPGEHAMAVLYSITNNPHQPITEHDVELPQHLVDAVDRALSKDPDERFASGREFSEALRGPTGDGGTPESKTPAWLKFALPVAGIAVVAALAFALTRNGGGAPAPDRAKAEKLTEEGFAREDADDIPGAIAKFEGAIAADPSYDPPWNNLGTIALNDGRYKDADSLLSQYVARNPSNAIAWYNLGNNALDMGDAVAAEGYFSISSQKDPNFAPAYNNLASIQITQGKYEPARATLDRGLAIDPSVESFPGTQIYLLKNRGIVALALGDDDGALRYWTEAVTITPIFPEVHLLMADWYDGHGQPAAAARSRSLAEQEAPPEEG